MAKAPLRLPALAALAALLLARAAAAEEPAAEAMPTRRNGFTIGLDAGPGIASIVGFPNDEKKLGYAHWYTVTGARPALVGEAWIGGAFTDWFIFSLGITASPIFAAQGGNTAKSVAGMFHIEAFPLFPLGGRWRDLGIRFDAGTGAATVSNAQDVKLVDSSAASLIGGGVFYEGVGRTRRFAQGPFLMGNYIWSDTARRPAIFIGWRASFSAGKVAP
jgi:hypothetical protein